MFAKYFIFAFVCISILARACYLIFIKSNKPRKKFCSIKTMIILGSGGHTAEMLRIVKHLNIKNYSPRVYIHARTDKLSAEKVEDLEDGNKDYKLMEIYRSREVRQSYFTSIWTTRMTHRNSMITVPWELLMKELENTPVEIKLHLTSIITVLRTSDKQLTSEKWISASITRLEACLDRTWEVLNSGYWRDVPVEYRYCYSLCIIVKAVLLELHCEINAESHADKEKKKTVLKSIINQIDRGILLGAPLPSMPNLLTAIATKLNNYCAEESDAINMEDISINHEGNNYLISNSPDRYFEQPSMQTFYNKIFTPKLPAVLTDCMNHWKALTLWKNLNYLNKIAGSRTVPIEIGSRYTEEDWTQQLVNFSEFLQKHVITNNSEVGYLAQHQLFEQIPELKEDFEVPEYCCFSDNKENDAESSDVDINAWFGPANTVSPLHFDPKNNLLSQIFGFKRIILYSPTETDNLYPYDTRLLNNTAQVDPIRPDYDKWPNFRQANSMTFYLKPGEMLYIPPKWWHHVTALTPSFSISFWWN